MNYFKTQVIEEEKIQENAEKTGTHFILELRKLMEEFETIGDVRGKGLMIGVELVKNRVRPGSVGSLLQLPSDDFVKSKVVTSASVYKYLPLPFFAQWLEESFVAL